MIWRKICRLPSLGPDLRGGQAAAKETPWLGTRGPKDAPKRVKRFAHGNPFSLTALFWHLRFGASLKKEFPMLGWALTFLIVALVAAVLGFGGIAGASASIAQMLFFVFVLLFIVAMVARAVRGKPPL
jgi:uncharacterized membrane protein YtjA (UPF0391 family)